MPHLEWIGLELAVEENLAREPGDIVVARLLEAGVPLDELLAVNQQPEVPPSLLGAQLEHGPAPISNPSPSTPRTSGADSRSCHP